MEHSRQEFGKDPASQKDKLAFDAENLVTNARESLQRRGVQDASKEQVVDTVETIVSSRRNDLNNQIEGTDQTLGAAVEGKLYTEEEQVLLAQARSREGVRAECETFIDGAELSEADALKLKEMMSEANYLLAVETAKELKASKIPTFEQIARELMTFTPERLREICEMMEKPEIVIESDQHFAENVAAMDDNKHYTAADGKPQENTYVNRESNSPYRNPPKPDKVKVKVEDGVPHPKEPVGVSPELGKRLSHYWAKFTDKGMKQIGPNGMAALLHQSMKRAQAAGDNSLIVDNWENYASEGKLGTITFIDPSELTESAFVAYSGFDSRDHMIRFNANFPETQNVAARGRASLLLLEI